jgi:SAM-dependent methyltransferase
MGDNELRAAASGAAALDGMPREQSYLENGSTFVDRLRTRLVCRSVLSRAPQTGNLRVLDLGCGYHATFLRALAPRLSEGVGIDSAVSEESKLVPRLRFALGTIESELPKQPDNTFDLVLFISVLEHLWNPEIWLGHCHRVLRQGGSLVVHVPSWYAKPVLEFSAFKLGTSPACEMNDHKMYYSKRDLWPMLVKAGFWPSRIRIKYTAMWMTLLAAAAK